MLDLTLTWLSTYLLHSTLLLGAAWAIGRLLGARAPALRTHLWRAALVGALVTATLQSAGLVTRLPQADLDADRVRAAFALDHRPAARAAAPVAEPVAVARATTAARAAPARANTVTAAAPRVVVKDWTALLVGLWLAGAAFGLARLGLLAWLARRELADRVAAPAGFADELRALAR